MPKTITIPNFKIQNKEVISFILNLKPEIMIQKITGTYLKSKFELLKLNTNANEPKDKYAYFVFDILPDELINSCQIFFGKPHVKLNLINPDLVQFDVDSLDFLSSYKAKIFFNNIIKEYNLKCDYV